MNALFGATTQFQLPTCNRRGASVTPLRLLPPSCDSSQISSAGHDPSLKYKYDDLLAHFLKVFLPQTQRFNHSFHTIFRHSSIASHIFITHVAFHNI